jgi:uncharacterized sulfatase
MLLFLPALLVMGSANRSMAQEKTAQPNIVVIVSDDQGWADYGFMGNKEIATPRLDRLARGYTPVPLCRPSLATILTGLYPHQHGVTGNDPTLPSAANPMAARENPQYARFYQTIVQNFAKRPNMVRELTSRGYVALQTGKWWEGDPIKTAGFTHAMTAGTKASDRHGGAGLTIGRKGIGQVTDFIDQAGQKPFFVWYAPMLPHSPHTPPEDLLNKYKKTAPTEAVARYWACVEWFDRGCGELLDHLDRRSLRENTIVLYVTDNGWLQDPQKRDRFAPRSKLTPYEGGVRTPIMVSWPKKIEPRMDTEHLASSIDLWPTVAALLKLETPQGLLGINLTDAAAVKMRSTIFGEQYHHNIADVDQPTQSLQTRWVISGHWKLIAPSPNFQPEGKSELYNLQDDPWEKQDLASQFPERVASLQQALEKHWKP